MVKVGEKVYLASPEEQVDETGKIVIRLKPCFPRFTFGYGWHSSTKQFSSKIESLDLTGKTVLDIGCGNGILAILCKKLGASRVVGLDTCKTSIEFASEHAQLNGVECEFLLKDMDEFNENDFDYVFCNMDFKQNKDEEKVLDLPRFSKPNGETFVSFETDGLWRLRKVKEKKGKSTSIEEGENHANKYNLLTLRR